MADIHFDYKIALEVADTADCLRINPGNIGKENKVREVIQAAIHNNVPIRVGVNAGSLEKDLQKKYGEPNADSLVESALRHADILDRFNFDNYKMSLKASNIEMTVEAYRKISNLIDQPLHLGITEAGSYRAGTVKSSIGVGMLLTEGIGDTIRISLASDPVDEIKVGWDILKSLNIRSRGVKIIACPSCSRQNFNVIEVVNELEERFEDISEDLSLIHISEPTRRRGISYAVFCLKKKKRKSYAVYCLKKKKIKKKKKNIFFFFFLMIRRPPRSTPLYSSAASDVYKRQVVNDLGAESDGVGSSSVRAESVVEEIKIAGGEAVACLLYTSDAADE